MLHNINQGYALLLWWSLCTAAAASPPCFTWHPCTNRTTTPPLVTISNVSMTPTPTRGAKVEFQLQGALAQSQCLSNASTLDVHVTYAGMSVFTQHGDLCAATPCPVCPGNVVVRVIVYIYAFHSMGILIFHQCAWPQVTLPATLPSWAPAGTYTITMASSSSTADQPDVFCVDVSFFCCAHGDTMDA